MIVVAGEALIDLVVHPDGRVEAVPGGGPFNAARTIARLGGAVAFLGRLSTDRFGTMLRDRLVADGVDPGLVRETADPTTLAIVELDDDDGSAAYQFHTVGTSAAGLQPTDLPDVGRPVALHIGTLGLVLEPLAVAIEALVGRVPAETLVMVDLNARPAAMPDRAVWIARVQRLLARAEVVSGSVHDLRALRPDLDPIEAAVGLLRSGPDVVLVTDGPRAAHVVTRHGPIAIDPPRVDVVDTVGAGDAFGGGFLAAWVSAGQGGSMTVLDDDTMVVAAAQRALEVASLTCTRRGAEPPTTDEVAAAFSGRYPWRR